MEFSACMHIQNARMQKHIAFRYRLYLSNKRWLHNSDITFYLLCTKRQAQQFFPKRV